MTFTAYGTQPEVVRLLLPFLMFYFPPILILAALDARKREQTQKPGLPRLLVALSIAFLLCFLLHALCILVVLLQERAVRQFSPLRPLGVMSSWIATAAGAILAGAWFGLWLSRKLRLG